MAALRQQDSVAARALEFLILTAARKGEARGARWQEIDLEGRLWVIPAARMKKWPGTSCASCRARAASFAGVTAARGVRLSQR
jgi:integrase